MRLGLVWEYKDPRVLIFQNQVYSIKCLSLAILCRFYGEQIGMLEDAEFVCSL